jgi:sugar phosphate permease
VNAPTTTLTSTPTSAPPTAARAWGFTGLLALLYMINNADKAVLGIIAQPLVDELGITNAQIGMVGSLFFVAYILTTFSSGFLYNRLGLRLALCVMAVAWSAAMLPLVFSATLAMLIVTRMLLGFTEGPGAALIMTATYSWHTPERRSLPGAVVQAASPVAKILIIPILSWLTVAYGWRAAIWALAIGGIAWAALGLLTWRDGPHIGARKIKTDPAPAVTERAPWRAILTTRTFLTGAITSMVVYGLVAVSLTWLPSYFETGLGYSRLEAGTMFAYPAAAGLVGLLGVAFLSDQLTARGVSPRVSQVVVPGVAIIAAAALMLALPAIAPAAMVVAAVTVAYGLFSSVFPMVQASISQICPPQQTAGTMGVFMAFIGVGGSVCPYLTGLIVDAAETPVAGYTLSFQVIALAAAIAAIAFLLLANTTRDKAIVAAATARV